MKDFAENFDTINKRVSEFGLGIDDADKAFSKGFLETTAKVTTSWAAWERQLGKFFGFLLLPVLEEANKWLLANLNNVKALATEWGQRLLPIVKDFIALWRGEEPQTDFVKNLLPTLRDLAAAFWIVIGAVRALFQGFAALMQPVAAVVNLFTGGDLSGTTLAWAAAIFYLVGGFTALTTAITLFSAAVAAVRLVMAGFGVVIAAVGLPIFLASLIAIIVYFTDWNTAFTNLYYTAAAFWKLLEALAGWVADQFRSMIGGAFDFIGQALQNAIDTGKAFWELLKSIGSYLASLIDMVGQVFGGGNTPTPSFAAGGEVRGAGTGTSDSLWARVSTGEFIATARAVKHWGAGLFHSLNNLQMPHFAEGGLVGAPAHTALSAAAIGAEARVAVDLTDNGNTFRDLMAPAGVAGALARYSQRKQSRSTGRKPSWR
jgi:hypothetical protein